MVKEQRLSSAPVLVVNLCSIFRGDRTHDTLLLCSFRNLNFRIQNEGDGCDASLPPASRALRSSLRRHSRALEPVFEACLAKLGIIARHDTALAQLGAE